MDKELKRVHHVIQRVLRLHRRGEDNLPWGALRRANRVDLAKALGDLGYNEGVEVGVRRGGFSRKLLLNNPNLHLTCVDPWSNYHFRYPQDKQDALYAKTVRRLANYNVTILRKYSMDAVKDFEDESIDFVFIDGNHRFDFAMMDIIEWTKKVKQYGIVMVHDYYHFGWAGVVQAVDAYTSAHHIDPWYVTKEREPTAVFIKYWKEEPEAS
jgi:predicted O-methyltransferase YrrM